jgi:hypothetical protein
MVWMGEALFDEYDNVACAVRVDCLLAIANELDGATTTSENV